MSNAYLKEFGEVKVDRETLREFLAQKPRRHADGTPIYVTEQSHKNQCDVNNIIKKYNKNGLISHVSSMKAEFGDVPLVDYKEMQDRLVKMQGEFNKLPVEVRKRFGNSPFNLISFMEDGNNREEAVKLGLIDAQWTAESDGVGEYVKKGENKKKTEETQNT